MNWSTYFNHILNYITQFQIMKYIMIIQMIDGLLVFYINQIVVVKLLVLLMV